MKRILSIVSVFVAVMMGLNLSSCSNVKNKLIESVVEGANENLPLEQGIMRLEKFKAGEDKLIMTCTILDESLIDLDKLKGQTDLLKNAVIMSFSEDKPKMKAVKSLLVAGNVDLEIIYQGEKSGKSVAILVDSKELKEMLSATDKNAMPEERLKGLIRITQSQLPIQIDDITSLDSVFLDEKNLVYGYSISKDFLDTLSENELDAIVQGLKSNEENIKAGIQMQIENDVNTKILAELCVKTNRGLQYIYHIDDNRDAIVFVTTDELKQHLK